jgi:hypothetical protein
MAWSRRPTGRRGTMKPRLKLALFLVVAVFATTVWAAEKVWQTGIWREAKVERPKVVFGVAPNNPNTGVPRSSPPATMEKRTYVIETDMLRLEIRQDATVDTPRVDVLVGEPVTFAMEKNDIWIKDGEGHEHKMKISKRTQRTKS